MELSDSSAKYEIKNSYRKFIIVDNEKFNDSMRLNPRTGTKEDSKKLEEVFKKYGFEVKKYKDLTKQEMLNLLVKGLKPWTVQSYFSWLAEQFERFQVNYLTADGVLTDIKICGINLH